MARSWPARRSRIRFRSSCPTPCASVSRIRRNAGAGYRQRFPARRLDHRDRARNRVFSTWSREIVMKRDQYPVLKAVVVAVAAALGGYAAPAFSDAIPTYTYCVSYPKDPGCPGYVPPAPKAAAPTPAAAPAPEQPKEKTWWSSEPGPPPNKAGECYTKVMLPAQWRNEPVQQMVQAGGRAQRVLRAGLPGCRGARAGEAGEQEGHGGAGRVRAGGREGAGAGGLPARDRDPGLVQHLLRQGAGEACARRVEAGPRHGREDRPDHRGDPVPGARGGELQDGGAQGARARGEQALRGRARPSTPRSRRPC